MRRPTLTPRPVPTALAAAGLGLAVALAAGLIAVPDLAGTLFEATDSVGGWIYLAVPALVFVETTALAGFVIHGELALLVGGVAAERGNASLAGLIALTWAAAVGGDALSLWLGRRLGRPFLERHGARVGADAARLGRAEAFFTRHGGKALLLGRFTGFSRAVLPFVAGAAGLSVRRLLPFSALSGIVWTASFVLIGFAFSDSVSDAGTTATRVALVAVLLVLVLSAATAHLRRRSGPPPPAAG